MQPRMITTPKTVASKRLRQTMIVLGAIVIAIVSFIAVSSLSPIIQTATVAATVTSTPTATAAVVTSEPSQTPSPTPLATEITVIPTIAATTTGRPGHVTYVFDLSAPKVETPFRQHNYRYPSGYVQASNEDKAVRGWVCSVFNRNESGQMIRYIFENEVIEFKGAVSGKCYNIEDPLETHRMMVWLFNEAHDDLVKAVEAGDPNKLWQDPDYQGDWFGWDVVEHVITENQYLIP